MAVDGTESLRRLRLIPGRSARKRLRVMLWFRGVAAVSALGVIGSLSLPQEVKWILLVFLGVLIISATGGLFLSMAWNASVEEEEHAGYTTHRPGMLHLPMVDDETGIVIREAGAPALSRLEADQARAAARLSAGVSDA